MGHFPKDIPIFGICLGREPSTSWAPRPSTRSHGAKTYKMKYGNAA